MVNNIIERIYNTVMPELLERFSDGAFSETELQNAYMSYLNCNIQPMLDYSKDSPEVLDILTESIIEEERALWQTLSMDEMEIRLGLNRSITRLIEVSNDLFEKARACRKSNVLLTNLDEYKSILNEINDLFSQLNDSQKELVQEIISETLLDLDYCYGKSTNISLRLSRII